MKIIKVVSDRIEDEIKDATNYAKLALETKDDHPEMSRILYTISLQEMDHMRMLHDGVVNVIDQYRREHGEPPEKMMAVYEYLHEKHIDDAVEAKIAQGMYK